MHHKGIELATDVEEYKKEALEEAEDQWYTTIVNNQDTMQENVHLHRGPVCIVTHQIMT